MDVPFLSSRGEGAFGKAHTTDNEPQGRAVALMKDLKLQNINL